MNQKDSPQGTRVDASASSDSYAEKAVDAMSQSVESAIGRTKQRMRELAGAINESIREQTSVGGTINNVYVGTSIERIVIYICITIVLVVWLSA
jgi:hypothetical protein